MVHIIFDGSTMSLDDYFQTGGGVSFYEGLPLYQRGHGFFVGDALRQRGHGLGDIFRSFWRILKPMAKSLSPIVASAGKAIGQEGLATTARVLSDVVGGQDLREAVASQGREGIKNLADRASRKLQKGSGRKLKRKRSARGQVIFKPSEVVGKVVPAKALSKRRRIDILGHY